MIFPVLKYAAILFFSLPSHADLNSVLREAHCQPGMSSALCASIRKAHGGAHDSSPRACEIRQQAAQDCCGSWRPSALCLERMDSRSRDAISHLMSGSTENTPEGVYGTAGRDKAKNEAGRDAAHAMQGVCMAMRDRCMESCGDPGATGPNQVHAQKCDSYKGYVKGFADQASKFGEAIRQNDQQQQNAGANPGPGGNQNSNGGNNTQQPQAKKGEGNPMGDLMKALGSMMNPQNQDQQQQQIPPAQDCASNPALAGCPVKAAEGSDSWNKKEGEAQMREPEEKTGEQNFNVASDGAGNTAFDGNGEKKFSTPPTVNPVQGGGGGGIPGQGGGAPAAAGAGGGGYAMASKNLADVMHGTMSGGGYAATNQAMQMQNGASGGGFSGYGAGNDGGMRGMDLRQFLPGGKNDPTRKLAGGANMGGMRGAGTQIQSQSVNIWNRISERFKSRCIQGLLRDCIP